MLLTSADGQALEALISARFVRMEGADRVALTDAGMARARELRFSRHRKAGRRRKPAGADG
ncbi:hypothetical protein RSO01_92150 [Reyranella soli]|uniref:Uncharacterized protein n=1 Tax=Reyranella soli TaxID=1230389 RepID=A0A512NSZ7_9HYPH|nr:hypothetical protein RSO01_92150 [Reyranella soli]